MSNLAVYTHWTGVVDWTSGLDWWTGLMDKNHFYASIVRLTGSY